MENKYDEAKGVFWGASLFLGALITVLLGFKGDTWLFAGLVGGFTFLIVGLILQGMVALLSKKVKK
jgi:hypothetical protein